RKFVQGKYQKRIDGESGSDVYDFRIRNAENKPCWVLISAAPIVWQGRPATLGLMTDITDRKQMEQALRSANKKLNLLSGITRHDINNQLTVLQGYLAILETRQSDPTVRDQLQKVTIATRRIASTIQFTKEYEEIGVAAPLWQDVRELVETAAQQAPLGPVTVNNRIPDGTEVFADPLISRVFYNLMDNAARYGGKITAIRVCLEERCEWYCIICEDDGAGVPADEKEKIFSRGFGRNTGLGLFLSREILSITGITITENGIFGNGARFEIMVPPGAYRAHQDP
ncbi:MAG: PAS domain-containing sensor histidine kinase, partial [Methanoregula sp.]